MIINKEYTVNLEFIPNSKNWNNGANISSISVPNIVAQYWFRNDSNELSSTSYNVEPVSNNQIQFKALNRNEDNSSFGIKFNWYYNNDGQICFSNYNVNSQSEHALLKQFRTRVIVETDINTPYPIYNDAEFIAMDEGRDYTYFNKNIEFRWEWL